MIDPIKVQKYSDKILEIIDNQEDFTRSDLQGVVEALVMNIIREIEEKAKVQK